MGKTKEELLQEVEQLKLKVSELKKSEIELEKHKALHNNADLTTLLDKIIDSSALSTWISDNTGTAIRVNAACLDFFGAKEDEIVGKYNLLKDKVIEEQGFMPEIKKVFKKGEVANIVIDYNFGAVDHVNVKNATHKIINSIFTPVLDTQGRLNNVIVQSIDLSEIKNAEKTIKDSEEKFRSIFEFSPLGKSITGLDGSLQINKAFGDMLGYTIEELMQKNWKEITHPDDLQESIDIVQNLQSGKSESAQYQKRYIHKNGNIVWADVIVAMKSDKENKPEYFITTVRDITESKLAEERIKRFSRIFEDSLNEIYLFDKDSLKFIQVNKAAQMNLGYAMNELQEMTPLSIKPDFTIESFEKLVGPLRNGEKEKIIFETIHKRKNQSLYNAEVHLQLLHFDHEDLFVAFIMDITNRKLAEKELKKHQENLEILVKERTKDLETKNIELDQAMKVFVGRELKIRELEGRLKALKGE